MSDKPTISVKGVGNVSAPPDRTVLTFDMSAMYDEYEESVDELNERVATLRRLLEEADVPATELKTTSFDVDAEYSYPHGKSERIFKGWKAQHHLMLRLPVDRDTLNKVLSAVTSAEVESEIGVHFEVSDRAELREKVLADATEKARRNADAMASAAGCRVGKVISMEYGWSEIRFGSTRFATRAMAIMDRGAAAPDIEPEDVDASDSVTVVWELVAR